MAIWLSMAEQVSAPPPAPASAVVAPAVANDQAASSGVLLPGVPAPDTQESLPTMPEAASVEPSAPVQTVPATSAAEQQVTGELSTSSIIVTGRSPWEAPDPLAGINAQSFAATEEVDRAVIAPLSRAYKKGLPEPVRDGIHNFLYNLREPVVFLNFLLQHKIGKATETLARFVVNSTVGVVGVIDIARRKPIKLPRRSNGFSNTLAFYGVPNGPFLYLPIVGPTTVRDLFGGAVDRIAMPLTLGRGVTDPKFAVPAGVLGALDHRAEFDDTYKAVRTAPGDPYANARDFYLQRRQAEIDRLHGRHGTGMGSGVGGMSEAPTGTIRLKTRSGAPVREVPIAPAASTAPQP